jgi:hypothetical protein
MKKFAIFCGAVLFLILVTISGASAAKLSDSEYKRMLKACPEFAAADKHLNTAWKALGQVAGADGMKKYKEAQADWSGAARQENVAAMLASRNKDRIPAAALKGGKVNKDLAYAVVTEDRALWLDEIVKQEKDANYLPALSGRLYWGHNPAGGYLGFTPNGWWTELLLCYAWAELPILEEARKALDDSSEGVIHAAVKGRFTPSMLGYEWDKDTPGVSDFSVETGAALLLAVNVTGDNVNVRGAPNTKGEVLFKAGKEDSFVVNKYPIKDSSGQEWYEIIFRYIVFSEDEAEEAGEESTYVRVESPAYITDKFIEKVPHSDEVIRDFGLGNFY